MFQLESGVCSNTPPPSVTYDYYFLNSNTHVLFQDGLFEHLLVVLQPSTPAEKKVMIQQFCSDLQGETFALVRRELILGD